MIRHFEYRRAKISFSEQGKGDALIFLHGFLEDKSMWEPLVSKFKANYRCICIDLLGHGSSGNLGYVHSMEEQAKMIKTVLNSLKLRRYIIIGHSMGGYVALELLKNNSKNIRGLCLQNSTTYPDTQEKISNRNRAIEAVKKNPSLFIQLSIPMLFSEKNRTVFQKEIKEVTQKALKTSTQGIIAALEGMKIRKNHVDLLQENSIPKLMIIGKQDPALNYDSLIEQTKNTPVAVQIFEDGHMSHIENFKELYTTYHSFFKDCS